MRKLHHINTSATPTTFDAKNAAQAHERVVARPNPAHVHIRIYG